MAHARITSTHALEQARLPQGWRQRAFDELDSTNAALRRMVEMGAESGAGLVIVAKSQTAGRGRDGRVWSSPPGNLYASFLVEAKGGIAHAPELGFVASLAVISAVQSLLPDRASDQSIHCKWPNDVLFDGAKVSGILLETVNAPNDGNLYVIVGIGLNLIPVTVENARYAITSLAEHGGRVSTAHALEVLTKYLAIWHDTWLREGFAPIREAWLTHAAGLGQTIAVQLPTEKLAGIFVDLDADGALVIEDPTGRRRILAGDLILSPTA